MSASTQMNEPGLSRREEMSVSGDAMSQAPWTGAAVTGGIVALGDFGWHVIGGSFGLGGLSDALSLGVVAFFVVAAAGALWRERSGRAIRWARANPWRFALLPGVATLRSSSCSRSCWAAASSAGYWPGSGTARWPSA